MAENPNLLVLACEIVAAYVAHNSAPMSEAPAFLATIHSALLALARQEAALSEDETLTPAVSVKKSIGRHHLICLEDGKSYRSLRRHLKSAYNLSPDEYRKKWGLPADYPMVAPGYSKARSEIAKALGFGRRP